MEKRSLYYTMKEQTYLKQVCINDVYTTYIPTYVNNSPFHSKNYFALLS